MRIVLDMIRGKRVPEALSILHFTPNHASTVAEKTLRSAIANFQMKPEHARFDVEDLYVRECSADGGVMLKRVLPAPQGRAFRIRKRSNHLRIVVGDAPTLRGAKKNAKVSKKERPQKVEAKPASGQLSTAEAAPVKAAKAPRAKKPAPSKAATATS